MQVPTTKETIAALKTDRVSVLIAALLSRFEVIDWSCALVVLL
jgi:hypothetical protein